LDKHGVDIYEFLPENNSIDFKTSITVEPALPQPDTWQIWCFSVYNKSDTELYLDIFGNSLHQIWKFNGSTAILDKDFNSESEETFFKDIQWWVTSNGNRYLAAGTSTSRLQIMDLENEDNNNETHLPESPLKLLWITKGSYVGVAVVSSQYVIPYSFDFSQSPIEITQGTAVEAPEGFYFESISTCEDYIAISLKPTTGYYGYAKIAILNLNIEEEALVLSFSGTETTLDGQESIPALARCCCCSTLRPLLVGSYDVIGNYTISVLAPDLSELYASTLLGTAVNSVGWSCQGESVYLTAAAQEYIFRYVSKYTFSLTGYSLIDPIIVSK